VKVKVLICESTTKSNEAQLSTLTKYLFFVIQLSPGEYNILHSDYCQDMVWNVGYTANRKGYAACVLDMTH